MRDLLAIKKYLLINTNYLNSVSVVRMFCSFVSMSRSIRWHTVTRLLDQRDPNTYHGWFGVFGEHKLSDSFFLLPLDAAGCEQPVSPAGRPGSGPKGPADGVHVGSSWRISRPGLAPCPTHGENNEVSNVCTKKWVFKEQRFRTREGLEPNTSSLCAFQLDSCSRASNNPTRAAVVISTRERGTANLSDGIWERLSKPFRQGPHPSRVFCPTREKNAFTRETGLRGQTDGPLLVGQKPQKDYGRRRTGFGRPLTYH